MRIHIPAFAGGSDGGWSPASRPAPPWCPSRCSGTWPSGARRIGREKRDQEIPKFKMFWNVTVFLNGLKIIGTQKLSFCLELYALLSLVTDTVLSKVELKYLAAVVT
jgi:hypothetical protein